MKCFTSLLLEVNTAGSRIEKVELADLHGNLGTIGHFPDPVHTELSGTLINVPPALIRSTGPDTFESAVCLEETHRIQELTPVDTDDVANHLLATDSGIDFRRRQSLSVLDTGHVHHRQVGSGRRSAASQGRSQDSDRNELVHIRLLLDAP